MKKIAAGCLALLMGFSLWAYPVRAEEEMALTVNEAVDRALRYSAGIQAAEVSVEKNEIANTDRQRAFERIMAVGYDGLGAYEAAMVGLITGYTDYEGSEKKLETTKENVRIVTTDAYWNVLLAAETVRLAESKQQLATRELSKNQLAAQLGMLDPTSLSALKLEQEQARADLETKKIALSSAYRTFNSLLNLSLDARPQLTDAIPYAVLGEINLDYHITRLLEDSPDMWQLEQFIKISEAAQDLTYYQGGSDPYRTGALTVDETKLQASEGKKAFKESVRGMYDTIRNLEVSYTVLGKTLLVTESQYEKAKLKYDLGMVSQLELLRAQYAYQELAANLDKLAYQHNLMVMAFEKPWAAR
jgi:outer membrane protein TolC